MPHFDTMVSISTIHW